MGKPPVTKPASLVPASFVAVTMKLRYTHSPIAMSPPLLT